MGDTPDDFVELGAEKDPVGRVRKVADSPSVVSAPVVSGHAGADGKGLATDPQHSERQEDFPVGPVDLNGLAKPICTAWVP